MMKKRFQQFYCISLNKNLVFLDEKKNILANVASLEGFWEMFK